MVVRSVREPKKKREIVTRQRVKLRLTVNGEPMEIGVYVRKPVAEDLKLGKGMFNKQLRMEERYVREHPRIYELVTNIAAQSIAVGGPIRLGVIVQKHVAEEPVKAIE